MFFFKKISLEKILKYFFSYYFFYFLTSWYQNKKKTKNNINLIFFSNKIYF
jgi:hypothetical protein